MTTDKKLAILFCAVAGAAVGAAAPFSLMIGATGWGAIAAASLAMEIAPFTSIAGGLLAGWLYSRRKTEYVISNSPN